MSSAEPPRFPPGFDARNDLQLEFSLADGGREQVALAGAVELGVGDLGDGAGLIERLPEDHRRALRGWLRRADDTRHLVARHGGPGAAAWWEWERIWDVEGGRVRIVRWWPSAPSELARRRARSFELLVVVGDPRQEFGQASAAVEVEKLVSDTVAATAVLGNGRVTVAASERWRSVARGAEFAPFASQGRLIEILRRGWDLVHVVAHGDPPAVGEHPFTEAGTLRLEEPAEALGFKELAHALSDAGTQLLTVQACYGGPRMAEMLLRAVPNLIVFRGAVDPGFSSRWAAHLYGVLSDTRAPVGSLVAAARARCFAADPKAPTWVPAHFSADLTRRVVRDEAEYRRERYLQHVRGLHAGLGGLIQQRFQAGDKLRELYVQLHLESKRSGAEPLQSEGLSSGRSTLTQLLERSRVDGATGRWVVAGHPGAGKSTSLRALACQLAAGERFVPVLIDLRRWKRSKDDEGNVTGLVPFDKGLAFYPDHLEPPEGAPWAVLLDGLDECSEEDALLKAFLSNIEAERVVVATRKIHYEGRIPGDYQLAELCELEREDQRRLLEGWFQADARRDQDLWRDRVPIQEAQRLLDSLSPASARSARVPFFLSILALLRADGGEPGKGASRREVLDQALRLLILGGHRHGARIEKLHYVSRAPVPRDEQERAQLFEERAREYRERALEVLTWVAFRATQDDKDPFEEEDLEAWLAEEGFKGKNDPFLLQCLVQDSGLWTARYGSTRGIARTSYEFAHRVLREALCAEHLAAIYDEKGLGMIVTLMRRLVDRERPESINAWGEPLALLTGRIRPNAPGPWINKLRELHPGLAMRVLANAELEPALVAQLLAGAEKRTDRWKQYEALFETEDPDDVLALLDLLLAAGGHVTEVPDLARLDDLARELAERHPMHGAAVERGRERILELLPELDALTMERPYGILTRVPRHGTELWALVPPGDFPMGRDVDEHGRVLKEGVATEITQPFAIARVPVTLEQYRLFDPSKVHPWGEDADKPVTDVTWYESALHCHWLDRNGATLRGQLLGELGIPEEQARRFGYCFSLATEAEWEYACRDGGEALTRFVNGNTERDLARVAWYGWEEISRGPRAVASKAASPVLRLYDMHGNIWEWCSDWYGNLLSGGEDPAGPSGGTLRVLRGGWFAVEECGSASRNHAFPAGDVDVCGFRVVLAPRPPRR